MSAPRRAAGREALGLDVGTAGVADIGSVRDTRTAGVSV